MLDDPAGAAVTPFIDPEVSRTISRLSAPGEVIEGKAQATAAR